ncbi:glycosyltransferase family 2 protein [Nocardioides pacificus]
MNPRPDATPDISVCICTYRRPALLSSLLARLASHDFGTVTAEIIVVDNDPDGSALPVVEGHRSSMPFPVVVRRVLEPSIALARNAAVAAARGVFVLMIDDDEWPEPGWATALLETQRRFDADAVLGPVRPHFADGVDPWIRDGGFFAVPRRPTGQRMRPNESFTGNALVRRELLGALPGPFDPDFGRTGGEDCMMFGDLERLGARLVWCAEAMVNEIVPPERATRRWLLVRSFSGGQTYARTQVVRLRGASRVRRSVVLLVGSLARIPVALLMALVHVPQSRASAFTWFRRAVAYTGQLTGIADRRFQHYRS